MGSFDGSVDWIRGRLHLSSLTDNYKKQIKLEENIIAEALKITTSQAIPVGLPSRRRTTISRIKKDKSDQTTQKPITIDSDYLISQFEPTQNCMAAIAAVDYAIKDKKPTCGLVMEFLTIHRRDLMLLTLYVPPLARR